MMDPISKDLYSVNDENNNTTQNSSQDSSITDSLSTTPIQSTSNDDNQLNVEQPFKKPKLMNVHNLDSSQTKQETGTSQHEVGKSTGTRLLLEDDGTIEEEDEDDEDVDEDNDNDDDNDDVDDDDEDDEEDDDEEEEDDSATVLGEADTESVVSDIISSALQQEKESRKIEDRKLLALLAHFDEEQLNRFETFRRATFAKAVVRRLIQSVAPCSISQNVVIAMAGLTKVFIGELVEEALNYKEQLGESGPLKPKHIREAYRKLSDERRCCTETPENPLL
ncbi:unnamed protein product [Schistosoma turkestanicum]|nr:unnamed protein product [Schistosoma turkestanicum]